MIVGSSLVGKPNIALITLGDKVRDTKMMMNTVCRIYLLFIVRNLKYVQVE